MHGNARNWWLFEAQVEQKAQWPIWESTWLVILGPGFNPPPVFCVVLNIFWLVKLIWQIYLSRNYGKTQLIEGDAGDLGKPFGCFMIISWFCLISDVILNAAWQHMNVKHRDVKNKFFPILQEMFTFTMQTPMASNQSWFDIRYTDLSEISGLSVQHFQKPPSIISSFYFFCPFSGFYGIPPSNPQIP